jgi:hypothetical protein
MKAETIVWRRLELDHPGHEFCRLSLQNSTWHLSGTAVFAHDQQPCRLDYVLICSLKWETEFGAISGWIGTKAVSIDISVDPSRRWRLNGQEYPEVAGCIDLDLAFSPSTNMLPIRRLGLAIGQEAEVRAAWLRFPSFTLEPLEQIYRRLDASTYRYQIAGGSFVAELQVNASGFVTLYPNLWQVETGI